MDGWLKTIGYHAFIISAKEAKIIHDLTRKLLLMAIRPFPAFCPFPTQFRDYEQRLYGREGAVSGVFGVTQASFNGSKHPSFSGPIHVLVDPSQFYWTQASFIGPKQVLLDPSKF